MMTLRRAAKFKASSSLRSPLYDGWTSAALKLIARAPALTVSIMAAASSSGVALGISPFPDAISAKMGRTSRVHPGQIAGAFEPRRAHKMPATNVPCIQATLLALEQTPELDPETS